MEYQEIKAKSNTVIMILQSNTVAMMDYAQMKKWIKVVCLVSFAKGTCLDSLYSQA